MNIIVIKIKFYVIVLSVVILNVHYFVIIIHVLATKQAFCTGNVFVLTTLEILTRKTSIPPARIG
jgi:hypothetical protein